MLLVTGVTVIVSLPVGVPFNPIPSVYTFPLTEILVGLLFVSVANPPLKENEKSLFSNEPAPPAVLYTDSLKVTTALALSEDIETLEINGEALSIDTECQNNFPLFSADKMSISPSLSTSVA